MVVSKYLSAPTPQTEEAKLQERKRLWWDGVYKKRESLERQGIKTNVLHDKYEARKKEGGRYFQGTKNHSDKYREEELLTDTCVQCGAPTEKAFHKHCRECYYTAQGEGSRSQ